MPNPLLPAAPSCSWLYYERDLEDLCTQKLQKFDHLICILDADDKILLSKHLKIYNIDVVR